LAVPVVTVTVDTVTTTGACPAGGSVSVLSLDSIRIVEDNRSNPTPDTLAVASASFSGRFDVTSTYQSCASMDASGGVWTFDANPGLNLLFDFDGRVDVVVLANGTSASTWNWNWDGTWSGTFGWSSGGRSGQCSIAVRWLFSSTLQASGQAMTTTNQTGRICGLDVTTSS